MPSDLKLPKCFTLLIIKRIVRSRGSRRLDLLDFRHSAPATYPLRLCVASGCERCAMPAMRAARRGGREAGELVHSCPPVFRRISSHLAFIRIKQAFPFSKEPVRSPLNLVIHYPAGTWVVVTSASRRSSSPLTLVLTTVTRLPLRTKRASARISPPR